MAAILIYAPELCLIQLQYSYLNTPPLPADFAALEWKDDHEMIEDLS